MKSKRMSATSLTAAALALMLSPGCHHDQPAAKTGPVTSVPEISDTKRLENTQTAVGAAADPTLYDDHFDAGALNSLGTNKLDLILAATPPSDALTIYLDVPSDATTHDREGAVTQYLTQHGFAAAQIHIEMGANPGTYHQSAPDIANYGKTDTSGGDASAAGH